MGGLRCWIVGRQGYKLVLTGHSLGGSIASLLTMLVRETGGGTNSTSLKIRPSKIFCWGYGSAPCVDRTLATSSNFICNVVLQDDLVARLSPASIEVLRREIQDTGWSDALKEGRIKTIVEKLEKAELGAFNMETLKVTTNHLLSQVATVAGRQSCSSVNTVQNFVYTGDDVSSSMASSSLISTSSTSSTSSTHGMTPCFSIYCGLKQFGEIPNYCCHSAPSFVNSLVGFACITQQGAI
jgi:hypothetical protein